MLFYSPRQLLLHCSTSCIRAVVTPTLSNRRGSLAFLQLIVFIMRKSCVDSYALAL